MRSKHCSVRTLSHCIRESSPRGSRCHYHRAFPPSNHPETASGPSVASTLILPARTIFRTTLLSNLRTARIPSFLCGTARGPLGTTPEATTI